PNGYVPYKVFVNANVHGWAEVFVAFAGREVYYKYLAFPGDGESADGTQLLDLVDISEVDQQGDGLALSILFSGNAAGNYFWDGSVNVAVMCRRSCRAYQQWQVETHDRLYAAYRARVAEYDERRM